MHNSKYASLSQQFWGIGAYKMNWECISSIRIIIKLKQ